MAVHTLDSAAPLLVMIARRTRVLSTRQDILLMAGRLTSLGMLNKVCWEQ